MMKNTPPANNRVSEGLQEWITTRDQYIKAYGQAFQQQRSFMTAERDVLRDILRDLPPRGQLSRQERIDAALMRGRARALDKRLHPKVYRLLRDGFQLTGKVLKAVFKLLTDQPAAVKETQRDFELLPSRQTVPVVKKSEGKHNQKEQTQQNTVNTVIKASTADALPLEQHQRKEERIVLASSQQNGLKQ